jgi:hypothetical protein
MTLQILLSAPCGHSKGRSKTLVIGTSSNHPVFRCHKPRSKPLGLLNVFGDIVKAAKIYPYAGYGGYMLRRNITLNYWWYLIKFQHQSLHTTFYTPMCHIFGDNERF